MSRSQGEAGAIATRLAGTLLAAALVAASGRSLYRLLVRGALTVDTGLGRSVRPLGPISVAVDAPRDLVFDVVAEPYLGRTPRAVAEKFQVLERGTDMVLAAHYTPVKPGLVATTLETVRFTRPGRVDFRLTRGPVPHVVEQFRLHETDSRTRLDYEGEIGADLGPVGRWWAAQVATTWERTVQGSLASIKAEAERRARHAET